MTPEIQMWIFSGFGTLCLAGLGGIYKEMKSLNKTVTQLTVKQAVARNELDNMKHMVNNLSCLNNRACINIKR